MRLMRCPTVMFSFVLASLAGSVALDAQTAPTHGVRPSRLVIRGAIVIEGNGTPAEGP